MKYISRTTTLTSICLVLLFMLCALMTQDFSAQTEDLQSEIDYLNGVIIQQSDAMAVLAERQTELDAKIVLLTHELAISRELTHDIASRGDVEPEPVRKVTMRVTAYDLSYASCKKHPSHPEYGITASGVYVTEHRTIAAGRDIPFGTRIYIPIMKDEPNGGVYVVEDRGSAIKEGCLDIYMPDNAECMQFGRQMLECYVLD